LAAKQKNILDLLGAHSPRCELSGKQFI